MSASLIGRFGSSIFGRAPAPASLPPGVEAENANQSHVRSTLTFRFLCWLFKPPSIHEVRTLRLGRSGAYHANNVGEETGGAAVAGFHDLHRRLSARC